MPHKKKIDCFLKTRAKLSHFRAQLRENLTDLLVGCRERETEKDRKLHRRLKENVNGLAIMASTMSYQWHLDSENSARCARRVGSCCGILLNPGIYRPISNKKISSRAKHKRKKEHENQIYVWNHHIFSFHIFLWFRCCFSFFLLLIFFIFSFFPFDRQ